MAGRTTPPSFRILGGFKKEEISMGEHDMLGQTAGAYLRKSRMEEGMDT